MSEPAPEPGAQSGPFPFHVTREAIRAYADAVNECWPIHHDHEAARRAGFRDLVAPPMFASVYTRVAVSDALLDVDQGIWMATILHRGQKLEWGEPVCAGDRVETVARVANVRSGMARSIYVIESTSENQQAREVSRGVWTYAVTNL